MKLTAERRAKGMICLFFIAVLLLGCLTAGDYGRYWDELSEIRIFRMAIMEYGEALPFETGFHQTLAAMGVTPLSQSVEMDHNLSLYYPIAFLACRPEVSENQFAAVWRCYTWGIFTLGLLALYAICRRMRLSRLLSCGAVLLMLLSPRFFAQGHYNNKDIALMTLCGLVMWQSLRLAEKPRLSRALAFGLAAGFCVNTRIIGAAVCGLCGLMIVLKLALEKRLDRRALLAGLGALAASLIFYVLLTPALLSDPWGYLTYLFQNAYNFSRWHGTMLFMGQQIDLSSGKPPFYYLPVCVCLTTPLCQLALIAAGTAFTLRRFSREKLQMLKTPEGFIAALGLLMWLLPLIGCMALRVRVYNGWRHIYFIYIPMMLTAAFGLKGIARRLSGRLSLRRAASAALAAVLLYQGVTLALNHPYQYAYYNPLVSRATLEDRYDLDYWNLSLYQALEQLSQLTDETPIPVACTDDRTRSGYAFATTYMTPEEDARFQLVPYEAAQRDQFYTLANTSYYKLSGLELPEDLTPVIAIKAYGATLCTIYACEPKEAQP